MNDPIKPPHVSQEDWQQATLLALQSGGALTLENQEYWLKELQRFCIAEERHKKSKMSY